MKNIRKFLGLFLVLAVFSFSTVACFHLSIEDLVEVANSKCPEKTENGFTVEKITYADKVVEYYVSIDEQSVSLNVTDEIVEEMRVAIIEMFKTNYKADPLLEAIVDQDLTLRYHYVGSVSGDLFDIDIKASDIKD